jgi:hypothetical protein
MWKNKDEEMGNDENERRQKIANTKEKENKMRI